MKRFWPPFAIAFGLALLFAAPAVAASPPDLRLHRVDVTHLTHLDIDHLTPEAPRACALGDAARAQASPAPLATTTLPTPKAVERHIAKGALSARRAEMRWRLERTVDIRFLLRRPARPNIVITHDNSCRRRADLSRRLALE